MSDPMSNPAPTTNAAPAATRHHGGDTHLLDRLSVLFKYRRAVIGVGLIVIGWMMVDSYTTVPMYRATARIQIEDDKVGIGTPVEIAQSMMLQDPEVYLQTQLRIIRGRELARRVAAKLELSGVPEFNGQGTPPTPLAGTIQSIKWYGSWPVRLLFGSTQTPPGQAVPTGGTDAELAGALIDRLEVNPNRGTQLVDLTFLSADPEFAARAANAYAGEYVDQNLEVKVSSLDRGLEKLTAEVERQKALVQASELKLAEYRDRQDAGALADNQNIVVARLTQLNEAVTRARTERIQREAVWKQVQSAGGNVDTLSVIVQSPTIQNLKGQVAELEREQARVAERYGDRHPDYRKVQDQLASARRQLEDETRKASQNAKAEYESALAQEQSLGQALAEQQVAASALGRKGVNYSVFQREAESNREIYNMLLQREKELRVVANSRTNNVRVVDTAEVPGAPFTPNHRQDWIYALFFGAVLGIAAAFAIDYLDDTVKTPEDITRRLKLKLLGLVPAVRGERHPLLSGPVPHDFGEAFRSLRTALVSQVEGDGPKVLAVTSAQPLEGKTTTAVNMALVLALGGSRVLLIDADMRRPSVNKALRLNNDRGLSQLLAGQARMREVVQRTHDPNLLVITAGRTPANPSELLASERMRALVSGLETGPFDWVVIDTPPVLAVTDAVIVAPLVAAVTFVVGAEMTRWRLAEHAVETILSGNPRSVVAVLNKVDFAGNRYYYSRYYGHQYKSYYAEAPAA
jgi:capsular exopolysaccharide synthesis family protein